MALEGDYAPPGVYTETRFEAAVDRVLQTVKLPVLVGTGQELLTQTGLEVVRGSSSSVDTFVPRENMEGRSVISFDSATGAVSLGDFDGVRTKIRVRNFPIVNGNGSGTTETSPASLDIRVNGEPTIALGVDGANGIIELVSPPEPGDEVRVSYFFNREDTLITDDLSDQVTPTPAVIFGQGAQTFVVVTGQNDTLTLSIDGVESTVTIPDGSWTAAQMAALLDAQFVGLTAAAYTNNLGQQAVRLQAAESLSVGDGTANTLLGLTTGTTTSRATTFYTHQGPIVDGSGGGVTTTNPADVTVLVDGTQVIPVSVDGQSRAVTLDFAPEVGAQVTVRYYFNSYQDTFDHLAHINVAEVTQCGITPDRQDYSEEADFVLSDDKIVWGTAALVSPDTTTAGATAFGESQISATLVDARTYLTECSEVTNTSTSPASTSKRTFRLPFVPTLGTGRSDTISQTLSNGRVDVVTNRPDLVLAYWGYSVQDALDRGPVTVASVDGEAGTVTLQDAVPTGASVYATFYYNTLVDETYTLEVITEGAASVGQYRVTDSDGDRVFAPKLADKGAALSTVTLQFPSGSELTPDVRFESPVGDASSFTGPVEEVVTVTFISRDDTPGAYTFPGMGDYYTVARESVVGPGPYYSGPYSGALSGASNRFRVTFDSVAASTGVAAGIDINDPTGLGCGFPASLLGDEIEYDAASGGTTYSITSLNNSLSLSIDGQSVLAEAVVGTDDASAFVTAINDAADAIDPQFEAASPFSAFTVTLGEYDQISLHYTGDVSLASGILTATLSPGSYATPALLAAEVEAQIATAIGTLGPAFAGLTVSVTAGASGRLIFTLTRATGDAAGYLEFIDVASPERDFSILAGLDTDAAANGVQTKILHAPVARLFTVAGGSGAREHDRIVLRNRIVPGSGSMYAANAEGQAELRVLGGTGSDLAGLPAGRSSVALDGAVVKSASLFGYVGWEDGQQSAAGDATDGQPLVTFYDGTGLNAANDEFKFTFDGVPVVVDFASSSTGTDTPLGPATIPGTVLYQIATAMVAVGLQTDIPSLLSDGFLQQEGAGFRLTSGLFSNDSRVEMGTTNANSRLGFTSNAVASRTAVSASSIASALMAHAQPSLSASTWLLTYAADPLYFAGRGLAGVETDSSGSEFLYVQSQTLGTASSVTIQEASSDDVNLQGTGLLGTDGDGGVGESAVDGFVVTSSDTIDGSGTANTSKLNGGVGQDGVVGQTYRDAVTGLTFTLLPREGGGTYPVGPTSFFTFNVASIVDTDANIPVNVIPGVSLLVTDTTGAPAGDSGQVATYEKGGQEPNIGDLYYVSYDYRKEDFSTQIFTRLPAVEEEYGAASPENPVSLAAYLQFINGSVLAGIKQVAKDEGSLTASEASYIEAVDSLSGSAGLAGLIQPELIIPLTPATENFAVFMGQHCDVQSSIRYRAERTCLLGFGAGTLPDEAGTVAQTVSRDRVRVLYPDIARMTTEDTVGNASQFFIDGPMLAAAFSGQIVSPNVDVATPWTNKPLIGIDSLARSLDAVKANQVAVRGVTVITEGTPFLKVRQGLTTDMTDILRKTPTVRQISDEVQRTTRSVLDRFVGIKYLPTVLGQIEGRVAEMFKGFVKAQIVSRYTGIKAQPDPNDPTGALIEGRYAPIFPLLYLLVRYSLRSSL